MLKFEIIFIVFYLINANSSLKTSDLCSTQENHCRLSKQDNKTIECRRRTCTPEFNFRCGDNHCTVDEASCSSFLFLNYSLKALMLPKVGRSSILENRSKVFKLLLASIPPCKWTNLSKWKLADVCMSGNRCFFKQRLPVRYNYLNIFNVIKCPCKTRALKYECGDSFCTRDKIACDGLRLFNSTFNISEIKLDKCQNDN